MDSLTHSFDVSKAPARRKRFSRTAARRNVRTSAVRLQFEPLESRQLLTVNWDGGGDGTSFTDPLNWDTNLVPGVADHAVINVGSNPTISLASNASVKSLTSSEAFSITGGSLTVNGNSTFSSSLSMAGGTLIANGIGTTLSASGATTVDSSSINAAAGAAISLPNLASYSNTSGMRTLSATGSGSLLSLPNLTSVTTTGFNIVSITASGGGQISFTGLTQLTSAVVFLSANGVGSQLDFPSLTTFNGAPGLLNSSIGLSGSGSFLHGNITSMNRVDLALDGPGTSFAFAALTSLANSSLSATNGGTLSLPTVSSYSNANGSKFLSADGPGSVLSLPNLTSITTTLNNNINILAIAGGQVNFTGLTQLTTSPINMQASGANSQLNLPALVTVNGTPGLTNSLMSVSSGGTLTHGPITSMDRVDIAVDGATSVLGFAGLTSLANSNVAVSAGATLSLPTVTSYSNANGTRFLRATGTGSVLSFPGLSSLTTTGNNPIQIQAETGGHVDLAALAQITTAPTNLSSTGAGSQINLPSLTTYRANNNSTITATTGGLVNTGNNPGTLIRNVTLASDATFPIGSNQTYLNDGATVMNVGNLLVQGKLTPDRVTVIDLNGNLTVDGAGAVSSITVTGTINLSGSLLGNTTNNTQSSNQGFITFDGAGTVGTPQRLEAMSADLGAIQSAFDNNFAIGTLSLANTTYARLVDLANNSAGAGNEAVYVKKLNVPAGTTLDLNGLNLYVRASTIGGTIVNGSIITVTQNAVVNRQIFYNSSTKYDVAGPAIMPFPNDNAIAYDKVALRPGAGAATFANVSSYTRGLNGVVVDITGAHGAITAADFIFRVGNNNTPSTWVAAPAPTTVTVRAGAGTGSDRVEIIWADGAITKKWLEVIVLANANTGLAHAAPLPAGQADVFFFGNALADSSFGNSATQAVVNTTDELVARNNPANLGSNIPVTNLFDYNRDGQVNTTDVLAARNHPTNAGNVVRFLSISNPPSAPESAPHSDGAEQSIALALAAPSAVPLREVPGAVRLAARLVLDELSVSGPTKAPEPLVDAGVSVRARQRAAAQVFAGLALDEDLLLDDAAFDVDEPQG